MIETTAEPLQGATGLLRPTPLNLWLLLQKGYSLRELIWAAWRVKICGKLRSLALHSFHARGRGTDIDMSAVIQGSRRIQLGSRVYVQRNAWLTVPLFDMENSEKRPYLLIGDETRIGPACTISAANRVVLGKSVLLGPNVTILDHRHEYRDVTRPISCQGVYSAGEVHIGDNAWLGSNSVVFSSDGKLTIGRNSVVSANSVVRSNVPAFCVVAGNPARIVRRYNSETRTWEKQETEFESSIQKEKNGLDVEMGGVN